MLRKPAQITIQVADIEVTQGTALPPYTADVKIQDKDKNKLTNTYTAEDFAKDLQKGKDITISSKADSNIEGTYVITVESGWFNSEVMLYMAFVAVANYTQPNFELGYALKFMRLALLILTALFNGWGFVMGCVLVVCSICFNKTLSGRSYLHVSLK